MIGFLRTFQATHEYLALVEANVGPLQANEFAHAQAVTEAKQSHKPITMVIPVALERIQHLTDFGFSQCSRVR
jgi:hypothetical protein